MAFSEATPCETYISKMAGWRLVICISILVILVAQICLSKLSFPQNSHASIILSPRRKAIFQYAPCLDKPKIIVDYNVGKPIINHPQMGGLWHCFTHMTSLLSPLIRHDYHHCNSPSLLIQSTRSC